MGLWLARLHSLRLLQVASKDGGQAASAAKGAAKGDAPPLCATYGAWTPPKQRKEAHMGRCTAIGCMGHLPFENMRTALGGNLLKVCCG